VHLGAGDALSHNDKAMTDISLHPRYEERVHCMLIMYWTLYACFRLTPGCRLTFLRATMVPYAGRPISLALPLRTVARDTDLQPVRPEHKLIKIRDQIHITNAAFKTKRLQTQNCKGGTYP
jgi:hypothetical protein